MKTKQDKMKKKVILGYPFSSSLYWLAGRENPNSWYHKKDNYPGGHPYYERLYGNHSQENINNAISLSLLFDDIILIAADTYFPNLKVTEEGFRTDPDLGVKVYSGSGEMESLCIKEQEVDLFLNDVEITKAIRSKNKHIALEIINEIIIQNYLAHKYDAVIIGSKNHLLLSKKVLNILNSKPRVEDKDVPLKNYLEGFNDTVHLHGINYNVKDYNEFSFLRQNKAIRKYAKSFKDRLDEILNGEKYNEKKLIQSMLEIYETNDTKNYVTKGLGITATVAGVLSLVALYSNPVTAAVGTVAGISGVGSDLSGRLLEKFKPDSWLKLVPEINSTLTQKRLLDRFKELEKIN